MLLSLVLLFIIFATLMSQITDEAQFHKEYLAKIASAGKESVV
jgi:hypothetical protein